MISNKDLLQITNTNHEYKHYYYFEKSPAYWYYPILQ